MGDDIGSGSVCFDFRSTKVVQLSNVKYVVYGCLMTIDDSLSLDPNWYHYPLITYLSLKNIYLKLHRFLLFCIGRAFIGRAFIGRAENPPETCVGFNSQKRIEGMYKLKRRKWGIQENKYGPSLLHYTAGSKYHWCQIQIRRNLTFPPDIFISQLQQNLEFSWNLGGWAAHFMISQIPH